MEYVIEKSPFFSYNIDKKAHIKEIADYKTNLIIASKKYFKREDYSKIISNDFRIIEYDNLSSFAKTLLFYICIVLLDYNSPIFRLKISVVSILFNRGESTIYKAVSQLENANYIAKTKSKEIYWINHNYFFKGNYLIEKRFKEKK